MTFLNEMANGESVRVSVATGKALVSHVEESKVAMLLDHFGDLLPLLSGRVNTRRVMGACVQEEDTPLGSSLDIGNHTLEVESNRVLVVVAVLLDLKTGVTENSFVVGPGWCRDIDLLVSGEESLEESGAEAQGTSARDGLSDGHAVQDGRVGSVGELGSQGREFSNASNAGVFLVQLFAHDLLLGFADRWQNVRLALIITICADAFVDVRSRSSDRVLEYSEWM